MKLCQLTNFFRRIIHTSLDFLFPRRCFGCRREKTRLCSRCLNQIPRYQIKDENQILAVFDYDSPVIKQAIWSLKYKRATDLAEILARPMMEAILEELSDQLVTTNQKIILI